MFKRTSLALGLLALAAGAGGASAADLGQPVQYAPPADVAPLPTAYNWTGAVVGLTGGYGWDDFEFGGSDDDDGGALLGGFVGYNTQIDPWVVGVEADAFWSDEESVDWFSTLRVRGGYAIDRFLPYVTAGVAVGNPTDPLSGDDDIEAGWAAGAGLDVAVTDNVIGRLEYQHVDIQGYESDQARLGLGVKF